MVKYTQDRPARSQSIDGRGYKTSPFIFNAINKYGWDSIQHEVLFTGLDQLNADIIEEDLIYYYRQIGKSYNLANGGSVNRGWKMSEEACEFYNGNPGLISDAIRRNSLTKGYYWKFEDDNTPLIKKKNPFSKEVEQIDKNTLEVIKVWDSLSEVERQLNIPTGNISSVCKGKRKTAGGFI